MSRGISNILLLLGVLDAVFTAMFRSFEPHLLTVSNAQRFEGPEESYYNGGSAYITDDEISPPNATQPRVVIHDCSIKLWDLSTRSDLYSPTRIRNKIPPLIICLFLYPCADLTICDRAFLLLRYSDLDSAPIQVPFTPANVVVTQSLLLCSES